MKRVEHSLTQWGRLSVLLTAMALAMPVSVQAESTRFTIIDARNGLTPEVLDAYAKAMGANTSAPVVQNRIKLITSARHGFEAGAVEIPEHVRAIDLDLEVLVRPGGANAAPLEVNHLSLARRSPQRIIQKTNIKGH